MDARGRIVIEEHMHDACWGLSGSGSASEWVEVEVEVEVLLPEAR